VNRKEIKETPEVEEKLSLEEILRAGNCIFGNSESLDLVTYLITQRETTFQEITKEGEKVGIERAKMSYYLAMLEGCGLLERGYRILELGPGRGMVAEQTLKLDTEKLDQVLVGFQDISGGLMNLMKKMGVDVHIIRSDGGGDNSGGGASGR
jgi:hypothetical protein